MNNTYEIIGNLLAALVVGRLAYLAPRVKAWLEANASQATQERIQQMVTAFARAAEQMFHDIDPSGEQRSRFVQQLSALGAVLNMIESAVWEINTETKKAQVQAKALSAGSGGHE